MHILKAIGQFWWDFIIGDDWKIAAAVIAVLTLGAALVARQTGIDDTILVPLLALALATAFTTSLIIDVKQKH